jgi:pimeloyl-ACP methyl ester carboxylesterase
MLKITRDWIFPTTMTGSYPKPQWHSAPRGGRPFKRAMGHTPFCEQQLEAVAVAEAADVSQIAGPVLLLAGEDDTVSPPGFSQSFAQLLADDQIIEFAVGGHRLPIERPIEITERLLAFL